MEITAFDFQDLFHQKKQEASCSTAIWGTAFSFQNQHPEW